MLDPVDRRIEEGSALPQTAELELQNRFSVVEGIRAEQVGDLVEIEAAPLQQDDDGDPLVDVISELTASARWR